MNLKTNFCTEVCSKTNFRAEVCSVFWGGVEKKWHPDEIRCFLPELTCFFLGFTIVSWIVYNAWDRFFFLGSINFLGSYTMFKTEFNSMENKAMQNHNIFWSQIFDFLLKIRASSQKKYRQIHMILVVPLSDKKSGETRKIKHQKLNDVTCSSLWFKKITGELNRKKRKFQMTKNPNDIINY